MFLLQKRRHTRGPRRISSLAAHGRTRREPVSSLAFAYCTVVTATVEKGKALPMSSPPPTAVLVAVGAGAFLVTQVIYIPYSAAAVCASFRALSTARVRTRALLSLALTLASLRSPAQNGINTALKETAGASAVVIAFASFAISTVAIVSAAIIHRPACDFSLLGMPWYAYCGGLLGSGYVFGAVYLTDQLGFAVFTICMILGQILVSLACDVTGFLAEARRIPSTMRIVAIVGVFVGAALISLDNFEGDSALTAKPPALVGLLLLGGIVTGSGMPVQALLNGVATRHLGTPFRASALSFAGGTLVLGSISAVAALVADGPSGSGDAARATADFGSVEPWMWTGGLCGALAITGNVIGVGQLGAASYSAIFVSTQVSRAAPRGRMIMPFYNSLASCLSTTVWPAPASGSSPLSP